MTRDDTLTISLKDRPKVCLVRAHITMLEDLGNGMVRFALLCGRHVDVDLPMETAIATLCWERSLPTDTP